MKLMFQSSKMNFVDIDLICLVTAQMSYSK